MVIVFIGPPGCGKGTQANILKDTILPDLNILTVSSLLKEKSQDQSVLGKEIKNKMDNGDLIEDTVVISVLKEKVNTLTNEQILIDGFPRSSIQACIELLGNPSIKICSFVNVLTFSFNTEITTVSSIKSPLSILFLISFPKTLWS